MSKLSIFMKDGYRAYKIHFRKHQNVSAIHCLMLFVF